MGLGFNLGKGTTLFAIVSCLAGSIGAAGTCRDPRAHICPPATEAEQDSGQSDLRQQEAELRETLQRMPADAVKLSRLGSILAAEGKFEESALFYEKALKLNSADVETRRSLATDYWQLGQLEKARTNLELVLRTKAGDNLAMLFLGMVSEELGDHRRAARLLGDALPLVRQRPETIASLARAYYHIGETEKARATLQLLIDHSTGPTAAFQGGRLAAEFKDYETAEKLLLSIRATYPDADTLNYSLALAQFSAKRYEACEETLHASIGLGHGTPDVYALLGWAYAKRERVDEMLKAFERAINMDPANETHFIDLGEALIENRKYGTALEVAKQAVRRFPSSSQAHRLKGSTELKMYLLSEALESYTTATELDPNNSRAALGLALSLWNMNRYNEAARSFEEGAAKFPSDAFFLLKYALFLLNAPGERGIEADARIKELLKKSEELDDTNAETHFSLGNFAIKENRLEEALREFQAAEQLDPEMAKVHFALARVYRRMGREAEAIRETEVHKKLKDKEEKERTENAAIGTRHP